MKRREYKSKGVYQINIVFDLFGGHHEQLRNDLRSITSTHKELSYLIERCQKCILSPMRILLRSFTNSFKRRRECKLMQFSCIDVKSTG